MSQVLVTGGGGYIGSVLVKDLIDEGHKVICLDRFFFGLDPLSELARNPNLTIVKDDIRWFDSSLLKNVDVVLDLAALSNDLAGDLDPSKTFDINFLGRSRVARLCKFHGVRRYILASSTSVYGFQREIVNESSKTNPLTAYAQAANNTEVDTLPLSSDKFCVTSLRFATVYGPSKRMRFDLVVNAMVLNLYKGSPIPIMRDGMQWRPLIHIEDVVRAYKLVMSLPQDKINGQIYNVGSNDQNYQILHVADLLGKSLGVDCKIEWYGAPDFRSYQVSFDKINTELGYKTEYKIADAARVITELLKSGEISDTPKTNTMSWYRYLTECHRISQDVTLRNTLL